jgi:hypothetical protein
MFNSSTAGFFNHSSTAQAGNPSSDHESILAHPFVILGMVGFVGIVLACLHCYCKRRNIVNFEDDYLLNATRAPRSP